MEISQHGCMNVNWTRRAFFRFLLIVVKSFSLVMRRLYGRSSPGGRSKDTCEFSVCIFHLKSTYLNEIIVTNQNKYLNYKCFSENQNFIYTSSY